MPKLTKISKLVWIFSFLFIIFLSFFLVWVFNLKIEAYLQTQVVYQENQVSYLLLNSNSAYKLKKKALIYLKINEQTFKIHKQELIFDQENNNFQLFFMPTDEHLWNLLIPDSTIEATIIYDLVKIKDFLKMHF